MAVSPFEVPISKGGVASKERCGSSVKFATVLVVRMRTGRVALGLVEHVRTLILFAHAVYDEYDEKDGAQQAYHCTSHHRCGHTKQIQNTLVN